MTGFIYLLQFLTLTFTQSPPDNDYEISFLKIDNKVEIIVNDSLVYTSGVIDDNPDLNDIYSKIYLGNYLTPGEDEVIIKLYNAHEPYNLDQNDKHWEIEYIIYHNGKEYDYMWDSEDDYSQGLVFEEKYTL